MNHYKYLGMLDPQTENISIDCCFLEDPLIVSVPINKWNVVAAINILKSKAMICIHTNDFSPNDKRKRICKRYFRSYAIISTPEYVSFIENYLSKECDHSSNDCYRIHDSKQFAFIDVPNGWAEGYIYKYTNENNEITAIEISFK